MGYDFEQNSNAMRQKDLVLAPNEYCFLQNKTNGAIKTYTGPIMLTISQQEALVVFDTKTKQFKEVSNFDQAKQLFVSAPENWYVILKNPSSDNVYPEAGKAVPCADLDIGRKVNVRGPISFSLYPGQMAKVVRGHALRSNQYLLARVYEAESASKSRGEILDAQGQQVDKTEETYVNGQILVIKGTEVSFYIPPTGIEVIAVENDDKKGYVRDAVTLERLEYCILKDEDGNKRYVHGPEVVFPEPTESFVTSPKGGFIFRAIELSKISGIYVKVIADYKDEKGKEHHTGEELFITGDQQMIYYPRPEHAIISYDGKLLHHAIAIPNGEGRYIMDRLTGEIKTVRGPAMYLPDPRTEVVVKRKLTEKQCKLWYPGNIEALRYNQELNEKAVEKNSLSKAFNAVSDALMCYSCVDRETDSLAYLESNANISRGTSYTKPRTITLDNRFDGVVSVNIWTGYAVNVISKDGARKVVRGPQTILLDYDQSLEVLQMSTGRPKSTEDLLETVYLRHENNKVSDLISVETKDFVKADIRVSYCVDFDPEYMDSWFNVENYVKYLCDRERSLIKRAAKAYTIEEFYQKYVDIVRDIAINTPTTKNANATEADRHIGRFFKENGMYVHDCEVLSIDVEDDIAELLEAHQQEMVQKSLELSDADKRVAVATALAEAKTKEYRLASGLELERIALQRQEAEAELDAKNAMARIREAEQLAQKQAEKDLQVVLDEIQQAQLARDKATAEQKIAYEKQMLEIETAKKKAYADTVAAIMGSISEDLVAAMTTKSNEDMLSTVTQAMAPYAIAKGESIPQTVNTLLRGTSLENVLKDVNLNV